MSGRYPVYVNLHYNPLSGELPRDKWELIEMVGQLPDHQNVDVAAIGFALEISELAIEDLPPLIYTSLRDPLLPGAVIQCYSISAPILH